MATDRLSTPSGAATTPSSERDWTDQVADLIVDKIDLLRDRTTGSIVTVARGAVYGLVALFVVAVVLIVFLAFLGRLIDVVPGALWLKYAVLGALFVLAGGLVWSKRGTP